MAELSIIPDLIRGLDRLQAVAQAAKRTVTRLTHPTIDQDAVPAEVITATLYDLDQALAGLVDDDEEFLSPAAVPVRAVG